MGRRLPGKLALAGRYHPVTYTNLPSTRWGSVVIVFVMSHMEAPPVQEKEKKNMRER